MDNTLSHKKHCKQKAIKKNLHCPLKKCSFHYSTSHWIFKALLNWKKCAWYNNVVAFLYLKIHDHVSSVLNYKSFWSRLYSFFSAPAVGILTSSTFYPTDTAHIIHIQKAHLSKWRERKKCEHTKRETAHSMHNTYERIWHVWKALQNPFRVVFSCLYFIRLECFRRICHLHTHTNTPYNVHILASYDLLYAAYSRPRLSSSLFFIIIYTFSKRNENKQCAQNICDKRDVQYTRTDRFLSGTTQRGSSRAHEHPFIHIHRLYVWVTE